MKENTRINNKYIKFYNTVDTGRDNFLVRNILKKPVKIRKTTEDEKSLIQDILNKSNVEAIKWINKA